MGHIYKLTNQKNGKIYIGKTVRTLTARFSSHVYDAKVRNLNTALARAIRKYHETSFLIECIETVSDDLLNEREQNWILVLKSTDRKIGYNLTQGGEGTAGYKHSPQTKAKISRVHLGRKFTSDHREKLRVAKLGKESWNKGLTGEANPLFGRCRSEDVKQKISAKKRRTAVLQKTINGILVNRWDSIQDACEALQTTHGNIVKCCKGVRQTACGFVWEYEGVKCSES